MRILELRNRKSILGGVAGRREKRKKEKGEKRTEMVKGARRKEK